MESLKKFEDITADQIAAWKSAKRKVSQVDIPVNEDDAAGNGPLASYVICQPERNVLDAAAKYAQEKNFRKANEVLKKNCILGGDMKYIETESSEFNMEIELAVLDEIGKLVESKKVAVKKL